LLQGGDDRRWDDNGNGGCDGGGCDAHFDRVGGVCGALVSAFDAALDAGLVIVGAGARQCVMAGVGRGGCDGEVLSAARGDPCAARIAERRQFEFRAGGVLHEDPVGDGLADRAGQFGGRQARFAAFDFLELFDRELGEALDFDGGRAAGGRPVPELTVFVVAPAFDGAARQRARVIAAGGDRADAAEAADCDGGRAARVRPVPELTGSVCAPAFDAAGARQRARVEYAGGDRAGAAEAADCDRGQAAGGRPVPELTLCVVAPAFDAAGARQRARVIVAGGDRADAAEAAHRHGHVAVGGGAVPELTECVVAPAFDGAGARQRARV